MKKEEFLAAIGSFPIDESPIAVTTQAEERIQDAVGGGGVLLVGETHGVMENPLVLYTLMRRFHLEVLGLEWSTALQQVVEGFIAGDDLTYSAIADSPDGRITAGHFAVLAALSRENRLRRLILFDPFAPWANWSDRDRQMAQQLLEGLDAGPAIVAAGNLHTHLTEHREGVPMGMHIKKARPASIEIRLSYAAGEYFNFGRKRFRTRMRWGESSRVLALRWSRDHAVLVVPRTHVGAVPAV